MYRYSIGRHSRVLRRAMVGHLHLLFDRPCWRERGDSSVSWGVPSIARSMSSRRHRKRQRSDDFVTERRRQASAMIPYWLSQDPKWRSQTIAMLEVPKQGDDASPATAWQSQYYQLYQDALSGFGRRLQQQPPPQLHAALDRLADAGFDQPTWSRKYRQMHMFQQRLQKASLSLMDQQKELEARQERYKTTQAELEQLRQRYDELPPSPDGDQEDISLLGRILGSVQAILTTPEEDESLARQRQSMQSKRRDLEKKIDKKQRILDSHAQSISAIQRRWSKLQQEQAEFRPPLPEDQVARGNEAVAEAMPQVCRVLAEYIADQHAKMLEQYKSLDATTDLTKPYEWYLYARLDRRKIIFHGGPTNSGKTFAALERLKQARRGMYLAPLRLLAAEVYEKLTAEGVYCNLYTGQEKREIPFASHGAATIEMASLVDDYDVIVIDEIQMIADKERGFAWTRALLGSRCKEIHVCGGLEAKNIVERIAIACGDEFELRSYERFSELKVSMHSLAHSSDQKGSYRSVQPGDCVVAFSRNDLFAIKREIETKTDLKCCVIYGSLPPQTRSEQARRFNDPDSGYDVLVASDAIGMGLNLNIRRIIFNSMFKNDGTGIVRLDHSAVKQISGRAGRRNSPYPDGEVTCRDPADMAHLRQCMATDIEPIARAGLLPTASHIEVFSDALNKYGIGEGSSNLHNILQQFNEMATVKSDFFLCRQTPMVVIARHLAGLDLSIREKYTLCMCPVMVNSPKSMEVLLRFAAKLAAGEVSGLSHSMRPRRPQTFDDLSRLCGIFNDIEQFLWLQQKFPPGNIMEQQAALTLKELAIEFIGAGLAMSDSGKLKLDHCYISRDQRIRNVWKGKDDRRKSDTEYDDEEEGWNKGALDI